MTVLFDEFAKQPCEVQIFSDMDNGEAHKL